MYNDNVGTPDDGPVFPRGPDQSLLYGGPGSTGLPQQVGQLSMIHVWTNNTVLTGHSQQNEPSYRST